MLKSLVKQANNSGAKLRVYKPKNKEYEYCISDQDTIDRKVRMGGTTEWLYLEIALSLNKLNPEQFKTMTNWIIGEEK